MNNIHIINKKNIALLLAVITFILAAWFFLTYSWLTIKSSDNLTKQIDIFNSQDEKVQFITIKSSPKTLLLKRDTYSLKVSGGSEVSLYKKSLRPLWFNSINVGLKPQQSSVFLGKSSLPCVKERSNTILFSSCSPLGEGNVIKSSSNKLLPDTPLRGEGSDTGPKEDSLNPTTGVLKNYTDGYLVVDSKNNNLIIRTRETKRNQSSSIDSFKGEIKNNYIATSLSSDHFAIYDSSKESILLFKSVLDKKPAVISLPKDKFNNNLNTKLAINNQKIYLASYYGETEVDTEDSLEMEPRLFIYDTKTASLINDRVMPKEWLVKSLDAGHGDNMLFSVFDTSESKGRLYIVGKNNRLKELDSIPSDPQQACWKSKGSFYYLTDNGKSIYQYSIASGASYLIYNGLTENNISNISCQDSSLYFSFNLTPSSFRLADNQKGYYHFELQDNNFSGTRIEDVLLLPKSINIGGVGGSVVQIKLQEKNVVDIQPVSIPGLNPRDIKRAEVFNAVNSYLDKKGVDTENITLRMQ